MAKSKALTQVLLKWQTKRSLINLTGLQLASEYLYGEGKKIEIDDFEGTM